MSVGRDSRITPRDAPPVPRSWLHAETLESLTELNDQCLELLTEQASIASAPGPPLLRDLRDLWTMLDASARQRAAGCPYLIVDAGFADLRNWESGHSIHESPHGAAAAPFFSGPRAGNLLRLTLTYGWHLARSRPAAARVLLGMSALCAERIAGCTLRQIAILAEQHPEWLQPRWSARVCVWREILAAAICGDETALERTRMRGLQLLAAEARALGS